MRRILESNRLLLIVYACLLLCLASYFVTREPRILYQPESKLPLLFLIRFGVFWFVSFMIAVILYFARLSYQNIILKEPDKTLARRLGYYMFWLGVGLCVAVLTGLYFFINFPEHAAF